MKLVHLVKFVIQKLEEYWKHVIKVVKIDNKVAEGYYVSCLGRFKNFKGVIMTDYKPHHNGYIYVRVNIQKYAFHRLIALIFLPNLENKPCVNHIYGNKINNIEKKIT